MSWLCCRQGRWRSPNHDKTLPALIKRPKAETIPFRHHRETPHTMQNSQIGFIGGGNMARSLVGGLLKNGWTAANLTISEPDDFNASLLRKLDPALKLTRDNRLVAENADVVLFAIKPQIFAEVVEPLRETLQRQRPLLISIAAGVTIDSIDRWSGGGLPIVRCMPNTPALVESGATGLFANAAVNDGQRAIAESLLRAVGLAVWLDEESLIDTVTALSGSGPAYFFLLMEALQDAASAQGLPADTAKLLALQTAFGAAKLALESDTDFATLRQRVTSRGGTTEAALNVFEQQGLRDTVTAAVEAAANRSRELAELFAGDNHSESS